MTPTVLKQRVLDELGVVAEGAPYAADDIAKVEDKYTSLHAQLLAQGLVTWAVDEDIPDEVASPLIWMLAFASANTFGVPEPRYSRLMGLGAIYHDPPSLGERQLRKSLHKRAPGSTLRSKYY